MQLTLKLVLAALVGITLVQAVNGYLRVRREVEVFETDLAGDLEGYGKSTAVAMERAWRVGSADEAQRVLREVDEAEPHFQLNWVARDTIDAMLAAWPDAEPKHEQLEQGAAVVLGDTRTGSWFGERTVRVAVPVRVDGRLEGVISVEGSLALQGGQAGVFVKAQQDYVSQSVRDTLMSTLATLAATMIVLLAVGAYFVRRPIAHLIAGARRIGQGDLTTRIVLRQTDELGQLATELDHMRNELTVAQARVESEVRARTEAQVRAAVERERRKEAVDQLRHADRLGVVGRIASSLVHELGAPLQVIAGRARMVERDAAANEKIVENARIAREQSERITLLVRQLLDFSRKGGKPGDRAVVEEVVERTTKLLEPIATTSKVQLVVDVDANTAIVRGDAASLQQVLVNLAINAVQAMPDGGTLTVRTAVESSHARIDVEDTGVGMSDDTRAKIFTPFFTTKPPGQGTGLGLCVVDDIVKSCGGRIDVESTPGKGTRFRVELPLA
jgi:signal transduction histidine kinase